MPGFFACKRLNSRIKVLKYPIFTEKNEVTQDCIKNKAKINPINKKDSKCFQYAVTVTLNNDEIKKDP